MPWLISRRRKRQILLSDDPQAEIWLRLSQHESEFAVREDIRRYYKDNGIEFRETEIPTIAAYWVRSLKQAKEYFLASQSVSLMTRPLLLFYGMLSLSKLLILLRNPEYPTLVASNKSLQAHGLTYQDRRSDEHLVDQDIVQIRKSGTFSELYRYYKAELPAVRDYSISDLYAWIPDLYADYLGAEVSHKYAFSRIDIAHEGDKIVPQITVHNRDRIGDTELYRTYPFLKSDFAESDGVFTGCTPDNTRDYPKDLPKGPRQSRVDELVDEIEDYLSGRSSYDYLTREYLVPQESEFQLNAMLATYMITYGYSRMCRYIPDKWGIALDGSASNEKWIIEKMVELATKTFPLGVQSILVGRPAIISTT